MQKIIRAANKINLPDWSHPIVLLGVCVASYGLLIPWLGHYWDGWIIAWVSDKLGASGLTRYFSTNRPVWGWIYQLTTLLLGDAPWQWQVFGLFWRWISAVSFWWLVRIIWPDEKRIAVCASFLFLIYPGFDQQAIANIYGHFFIVQTSFLISLALMLKSIKTPQKFWLYTIIALFSSALNLFSMEYFFMLDLIRPILIWVVLCSTTIAPSLRLKETIKIWSPYLVVFIVAMVWRTFIFSGQTSYYKPWLVESLKTQPIQAILRLLKTVLWDEWSVNILAWIKPFIFPKVEELGLSTTRVYWFIIVAVLLFVCGYLYLSRNQPPSKDRPFKWQIFFTGFVTILLAGLPFWLTELPIGTNFPNSRFTLPFIMGTSLLVVGGFDLIPVKVWMKVLLFSVLVSFSVGLQFTYSNYYRRDWNAHRNLFWQMSWRVPGLKEGTTILSNDLPISYSSDNSLTAPLNWIYAPDNSSDKMSFMFYYPSVRLNLGLKGLEKEIPITQNYYAATFSGSTSAVLTINWAPPACLHVLDPEIDADNKLLPELLRDSAALSDLSRILVDENSKIGLLPSDVFGDEPEHNWCYFYQKADLARQIGDWETIVVLGDEAFNRGDRPNDPSERIPFIEGYAHTGNWQRAIELTKEAQEITPLFAPNLCRVWQRIDRTTEDKESKNKVMLEISNDLSCQELQ